MFLLLFHACVTKLNIKMELACARGVFLSEGAATMRSFRETASAFITAVFGFRAFEPVATPLR